ncbi:MAG: dihydrofolate reductase [Lewinellaceae bacterium]|nr:dihydrofolate reductase [Saprospiraceae bacterium]MCB9312096.1 dihydrofolate reductase [Lewinellaceae bacterium]HRW75277.1 dihydrofolate reductase family protein [Saprospiraceae bacterium]
MRKMILYTAISLDGYIAGPQGEIDWLYSDDDYGYYDFYETIDTLLMGRTTYDFIAQFSPYPHADRMNYVFTRTLTAAPSDHLRFVAGDPVEFARTLKAEEGKPIWLVGGGQINAILFEAGLVDEIILSIHPTILGRGIHLFTGPVSQTNFKTIQVKTFPSGLVQWHGERQL